jgi:hypothetical protein
MREDTTGMSAEIIPVIPSVMISTGVGVVRNPASVQLAGHLHCHRSAGHHDARTLLVVSAAVQISPFGTARTLTLAGLSAAHWADLARWSRPASVTPCYSRSEA